MELQYLIDMAEIPTFQEMQTGGFCADAGDARTRSYLKEKKPLISRRAFRSPSTATKLVLRAVSQDVIFPPGAGNLPTMKTGFVFRAVLPAGCGARACELVYADANFPDHAGWKEIVVTSGAGAFDWRTDRHFRATAGARLTDYPTDLINSPPQDLTARRCICR